MDTFSEPSGIGMPETTDALVPGTRFRQLQALEDALKHRRARIAEPCPDCAAAPGGRCDDHARDLGLIGEYEAAARALGARS